MDEDQLDAIVSRLENRLRAGWKAAMRDLKDETKLGELVQRIAANDLTALVDGVEDAIDAFTSDLAAGYVYAGQKAAKLIDDGMEEGIFRFDLADADAVDWMQRVAERISSDLVEDQQVMARRVVQLGRQRGISDRAIAEEVQASIGLGSAQVDQVARYRSLLEQGDYARAVSYELADGRYDAALERLDASGGTLGAERIESMVDRYRDNWIEFRGDGIALEEAQNASNAGVDEALSQAVAADVVDDIRGEWVSMGDSKVRQSHRHLNGFVVPDDGDVFPGLYGDLRYPGDEDAPYEETANCRCMLRRTWGYVPVSQG